MPPVAPTASAPPDAASRRRLAAPPAAAAAPVTLWLAVGAAGVSLQALWSRALAVALAPLAPPRVAIAASVLLGLALGAGLGVRSLGRTRQPALAEALSLWAVGLAVWLGTARIDRLGAPMRQLVAEAGGQALTVAAVELAVVAAVVLPAALALGALAAQVIGAASRAERGHGRPSRALWRTGAWALAGALVGHMLARGLLMPVLGLERGLRAVAGACAFLAAARLLRAGGRLPLAERLGTVVWPVALAVALVMWPRWDLGAWTAGAQAPGEAAPPRFVADGIAASVAVFGPAGRGQLAIDGHLAAAPAAVPAESLAGALPALLRPAPATALVLGVGTGASAAALAAGPAAVTLWEPEPAVFDGARRLGLVVPGPWDAPRLHAGVPPRRARFAAAVAAAPRTPACPDGDCAGAAIDLLAPHLADGATLTVRLARGAAGRRELADLRARFAHVVAVEVDAPGDVTAGQGDLVVIASDATLQISGAALAAAVAANGTALGRAGIADAPALLAHVVADETALRPLGGQAVAAPVARTPAAAGLARDLTAAVAGERTTIVRRLLAAPADARLLADLGGAYLARGLWTDAGVAAAAARDALAAGHDATRAAPEAREARDDAAPEAPEAPEAREAHGAATPEAREAHGAATPEAREAHGAATPAAADAREAHDDAARAADDADDVAALAGLLGAPEDAEGLGAAVDAAADLPALGTALAHAAAGEVAGGLAALEADRPAVAGSAAAMMVYGALLLRAGQPGGALRVLAAAADRPGAAAVARPRDYFAARAHAALGQPVAAVAAMRRYRGATLTATPGQMGD